MTSRPPQVFTSYLMLSLLRFASICFDLLRFASICFDLEKGTIVTKFVVVMVLVNFIFFVNPIPFAQSMTNVLGLVFRHSTTFGFCWNFI